MSNVIDQRVVEMKFDNSDFEKNVKTSIESLDNLKKSLDTTESVKAFENIGNASQNLKLDGVAGAVETVQNKFSALEAIALGALMKIGNQAVSAGEKLLKSFTVDNVAAGWSKFAEKTVSVGTLISQGFNMDEVEQQLNRLAWFTDETSYNFTDMVSNIGKFTASGKGLTESVTAMEGIATWAALSGQNATKASSAMYQLAQAMGKGALKLDDFKSIQNVSMDTDEFRQKSLDAAVGLKTLKKVGEDCYETLAGHRFSKSQFTEYLTKDAWYTSDVMLKVFNEYSAAVDQIYEKAEKEGLTASEAMQKYGKEFDEFGLKAFKAAQEARTWGDVVDSVKDAVSSTWMKTFELIFGNYEEATALWTKLANQLYDVFAEGGNLRNELLEEWKDLGGRDVLLWSFENLGRELIQILDIIKEAFRELFPETTAQDLQKLTWAFRDFTTSIKLNEETSKNLKDTFKGVFSILRLVCDVIGQILKILFPTLKTSKNLLEMILKITGTIGRFITGLTYLIEKNDLIAKGFQAIADAIQYAIGFIVLAATSIADFITKASRLQVVQSTLQTISKALNVALNGVILLASAAVVAFSTIYDWIKKIINTKFVTESMTKVKNLGNVITSVVKTIIEKIKQFFELFKKAETFADKIELIKDKIVELKDKIVGLFKNEDNPIDQFDSATSKADFIKNALDKISTAVKNFCSVMTPGRIAAFGFAAAVIGIYLSISKLTNSFSAAGDQITKFFKTLNANFNPLKKGSYAYEIEQIAIAVALLAGSLYLISRIDSDKMLKSLGMLSACIGELLVVGAALAAINKFIGPIEGAGVAILALAAGVAILAASFLILDKVNMEGIWKKVLVIGAIAAELATVSVILSLMKHPVRGALTLLAFALSISKAVEALALLADIDYSNIQENLKYILILIGGMAALSLAAGNLSLGSLIGVLGLALVLKQLFPVLKELSNIDFDLTPLGEKIEKSKTALIALGVFVGAIAVVAGLLGKGAVKFAIGIGILTGCVFALIKFSKELNKLTPEEFSRGAKTMAAAMAMFAVMSVLADFTSYSKMISFATSIVIMTGAIALLAVLGKYIGGIDEDQFKQGAKAIVGLMAMIALLEGLSALTGKANNKAITAMIIGLVALFGELIVLSLIPFKDLIQTCISMSLVMVAFGTALALASAGHKVNLANVMQMIMMAGVLAEFGFVLKELSTIGWKRLATSVAALSVCLLAFAGACRLITNLDGRTFGATGKNNILSNKMKAMIIVCGSMAALGAALYLVGQNPWQNNLGALAAMTACIIALAGTCYALTKIKGIKVDSANHIFKLATAMLPMALAITMLANFEWKDIYPGLIAMGLSLAALVTATAVLTLLSGKLAGIGGMSKELLAMGVAMIAIAAACKIFQTIQPKELISAGEALLAVTAALAVLMAINWGSAGLGSLALSALAAVFLSLGTAGLELAIGLSLIIPLLDDLQNVDLTQFGNSLKPLSSQLLEIGLASISLSAGAVGLLAFAVASIVVAGAAYILAKAFEVASNAIIALTNINAADIVTVFMALGQSLRIIADVSNECFSGLAKLAVVFTLAGNGAIVIAVAFAIFAATLPLLANGIDAINRSLQNVDTESLGLQLKQIGEGLDYIAIAAIKISAASMGLLSFAVAAVAFGVSALLFAGAMNLLDNVNYETISSGLIQLGPALTALCEGSALDLAGTAAGIILLAYGLTILAVGAAAAGLASSGIESVALALSKLAIFYQTVSNAGVSIFELANQLAWLGTCLIGLGVGGILALAGSAGIATTALALQSLITSVGSVEEIKNLAEAMSELSPKLTGLGVAGIVLLVGAPGVALMASALNSLVPALSSFVSLELDKLAENVKELKDSALGLAIAGAEMGVGAPGMHAMATAIVDMSVAMTLANTTFTNTCKNITNTFVTEMGKLYKQGVKGGEDALKGILKGSQNTSIRSNIKQAWTNVVNNDIFGPLRNIGGWHSPWSKLVEAAKDALQGMVNGSNDPSKKAALKSAWKDVCQNGVMSNVTELAGQVKTKAGEILNNLKSITSYSDLIDTVTTKTKKAGNGINEMQDIIKNYVSGQVDANDITKEVTETMNDYTESLGKTGSAATETKDALSELTDKIAGQIDLFSEFSAKTEMSSEQLLANMKSQIDGVTKWADMMATLGQRGIDEGLLEYLGNLGPQGYEYVNAFVNMTGTQLEQANQYFQKSLTLPGEAAATIQNSYANAGAMASLGFANGISSVEAAAKCKELGLTALEALQTSLDEHSPSKKTEEMGEFFSKGFDNGVRRSYLTNTIPMLVLVANGILNVFKANLNASRGEEVGKAFMDAVTTSIQTAVSQGFEVDPAWVLHMVPAESIALLNQKGIELGTNLDNGIITGVNNSYPSVINRFNTMCKSIVLTMKQILGTQSGTSIVTRTVGKNLTDGLISGVNSGYPSVINTVTNLCRTIINTVNSNLTYSKFYSVGKYISQGLAAGMESEIPRIEAAAAKMIAAAEKATRATAKIKSPSRLFMGLGNYISEGLAIGIEKNTGVIEDASGQMVNRVYDITQKLSDLLSVDMDLSPTITPVINMDSVREGAEEINSIFGNTNSSNLANTVSYGIARQQEAMSIRETIDTTNNDVVSELVKLRGDVNNMSASMSKIKMVLNTGTLVGEMIGDIDSSLGARTAMAARGI